MTMTGGVDGVTVKLPLLVTMPPSVMTVTGPDVAPTGTLLTVICVSELAKKLKAPTGIPLKITARTLLRFVPKIFVRLPMGPLLGPMTVIVGTPGSVTVKSAAVVAMPAGVMTVIGPVVAVVGTVAVICMSELTVS